MRFIEKLVVVTLLAHLCIYAPTSATPRLDLRKIDERKYGFLDLTGRVLIPPRYFSTGVFNHGYSQCIGPSPTGEPDYDHQVYVDFDGKESIVPSHNPPDLQMYDKVKIDGKTIIQNNFQEIWSTCKNYKFLKRNYDFSVAKPDGSLTQISFDKIWNDGSTGMLCIEANKQSYGFTGADSSAAQTGFEPITVAKPADETKFYSEGFHEGLAAVRDKDGQWSYIDSSGKTAIKLPKECCSALSFSEGLAAVAIGGTAWGSSGGHSKIGPLCGAKFGFIDKTGKFVISAKFPCPPEVKWHDFAFKNGYCLATRESNAATAYGYIDKAGRFVIQPKYCWLGPLGDGRVAFRDGLVGFDKRDVTQQMHEKVLQLIKQFELISMPRSKVIELLGEPTGISKEPVCEYYLLESGCGGSSSIGFVYHDGRVAAYAVDSFSDYVSPRTNTRNPIHWIVTNAKKPIGDENLYEFSHRAGDTIVDWELVKPRDGAALHNADRSFVCPLGQQPFDNLAWKNTPNLRHKMIFALYHQNWWGKRVEDLQSVLNAPDLIEDKRPDEQFVCYNLALTGYQHSYVRFFLLNKRIHSMGVEAMDDHGIDVEYHGKWHYTDSKCEHFADDYNALYSLVGFPVDSICQLMQRPGPRDPVSGSHASDGFEFKYSPDETRVDQFRVNLKTIGLSSEDKWTNWIAQDFHPRTKLFYSDSWTIGLDKDLESNLVDPFHQTFSVDEWKTNPARQRMLTPLVYKYAIVGMEHDKVVELLGPPDETREAPTDLPLVCNSGTTLESYRLWPKGSEAIVDLFQILYGGKHAVAFRVATERTDANMRYDKRVSPTIHEFYVAATKN